MTLRTSTITTIRAVIMSSCLIAFPALAISGKSFPKLFCSLVDRDRAEVASSSESSDVVWPIIVESTASVPSGSAGVSHALAPVAPATISGQMGPSRPVAWPNPVRVAEPAAIHAVPAGSVVLASYQVPSEHLGLSESPNLVPIDRATRASADSLSVSSSGRSTPLGRSERSDQIQQRLRQLGATYYLLESWGSQAELYRFYCRVAVVDSSHYCRYFEATDVEPLTAMSKVLAKVEAWRDRGRYRPGGRR